MIYTWRIAFEDDRAGFDPDAMIVRAPTAADALTLFGINYGEPADRMATDMSVVEAVADLGYCPLCIRQWDMHKLDPEASVCMFRRGWVLESKLDDVERKRFGLPAAEKGTAR